MKLTSKELSFINILLVILVYFSRSITDALYVSKNISNVSVYLKYLFMLASIIFCFIQLRKKENKTYIFKKELLSIYFIIISFLFITLLYALKNGNFYQESISELIKIIIPITYAFFIINVFDFKEIYYSMVGILICSFLGYILEIGIESFTLSNVLTMSFDTSYSPFESHFFSGASIALCAFFMYYRKNKLLVALSLLFVVCTFKRLSVVFAIFLLILPYFTNINKKVNKNLRIFISIFFIVITLIYYYLLIPSSANLFYDIFGKTQREFTMSRNDFLARILYSNYSSSGIGSVTHFLGKTLEMDLIQIYLEVSIIGLMIFVWNYWKCAGNTIYTYIYMFFQFSNMLTSQSLYNSFNWVLVFIVIGCISYKNTKYIDYKLKKGVNNEKDRISDN